MAREMLLVDPAMLAALQSNKTPPTSQNIASRVIQEADNDINNILNSDMEPNDQLLHYNQSLQKRDQYADKTPSRIFQNKLLSKIHHANSTETTDPMEEIIESVPKTFTAQAACLVKKMKQGSVLGWNAQGNIKYKG